MLTRPTLGLALLPLVLLAGCATEPNSPGNDATTGPAPTTPVGISWKIEGGGDFVEGIAEVCDLATSFSIEDFEMTTNFYGETPVTSMTFMAGRFIYSTVWPDQIVATGVATGEGTYELELGGDGLPVALHGTATVTWHDAETDEYSERPDTVELSFTAVDAPDYCQS